MTDFGQIVGIAAGVISIVASFLYIKSIIKKKTLPSKSTWWILTLVGVMILWSYWESGARNTIWIPVVYIISNLVIAVLSIRFGENEKKSMWKKPDPYCVAGAILGAIIWWQTASAPLALAVFIGTDFLGIYPTIQKAVLRPWTEEARPWKYEVLASALNFFAVEQWSFVIEVWLYPFYMLLFNGIILLAIIWPRRQRKEKAQSSSISSQN